MHLGACHGRPRMPVQVRVLGSAGRWAEPATMGSRRRSRSRGLADGRETKIGSGAQRAHWKAPPAQARVLRLALQHHQSSVRSKSSTYV